MGATRFHIPDLVGLCGPTFELHVNKNCHKVAQTSQTWAATAGFLTGDEIHTLDGLQLPLLASLCFPSSDINQLEMVTKIMILFLHWSKAFDSASAGAFERLWGQLLRETPSKWQKRFSAHLQEFRQARTSTQSCTDCEHYKTFSRSHTGIMMTFDFVEYTAGLRIPMEVHASLELRSIEQCAHDIIASAKDIASYNREQSTSTPHNLVAVIMKEKACTLECAIDTAEDMLKKSIESYLVVEKKLPSWTPEIDEDLHRYLQGLRDCIIGAIHWLYETDRYFGDKGEDVRKFGWVFLLAKRT